MDRTVTLQLHPTPEQAVALQETLRQFTEAFNAVCTYGWQHGEKNGVKLHHGTYRSTKEACSGLVSDLLIQARVKATEALKSAQRHLNKLSKRQQRFHRDCDHVLSKRIVQNAPPGSTIVLENLSNIRETSKMGRGKQNKHVENKRRLHSWTFAQLYNFVAYKAQERGMAVVKIDPRHTSQTCSRCGYQARNNRRSQSLFHCRTCGYCLNADLNAAINIREKYLASLARDGTPVLSGPQSSGLSSQFSD